VGAELSNRHFLRGVAGNGNTNDRIERLVLAFAERDFEIRLVGADAALAVADLLCGPKRRARVPPPAPAAELWENADAVARWVAERGVASPREDDNGAPPDCGYIRPITGIRRSYDEEGRERARLTYGPLQSRWAIAVEGAERFLLDGWALKAVELGWSVAELYNVPSLWSQIHLTGVALLVGDRKVVAVTADAITIETDTGARLKFRRRGREHIA
jgi:hypothetical protein